MAAKIAMPKLGMTMVEGTIKRWLKEEGQPVEAGTPVLEIETEKVVYEVEAPGPGILRIASQEGTVVPCGGTCGLVAASQEEYHSLIGEGRGYGAEGRGYRVEGIGYRVGGRGESPAPEPLSPFPHPPSLNPQPSTLYPSARVIASPIAKRLALELGVDLTRIKGTGPGGRIVEDDVRGFADAARGLSNDRDETAKTITLTGKRKTIADHMVRSLQTSAQLTIITDVDATALSDLHRQLMAEAKRIGVRISHNDLIVAALIRALVSFPIFNSTIEGDDIKVFERVNLGVAVPLEDGLIVPVVHEADKLTLVELSRALAAVAEKAQEGTLTLDEVTGGTFTLSNLSAFDVMAFTPIINPPQSAILGVGGMEERPAVVRGQLAVRPTFYLSLTWDHRVADGVPAAKFLRAIKHLLERPSALLV
ncbi:MAG: 2-oxo acid dehydrogenase subunit E2 [Chloroflexi bacterium]|nr:2-oxo acid dehydrogenase subunit E2 [Chloroflexota bacterium]